MGFGGQQEGTVRVCMGQWGYGVVGLWGNEKTVMLQRCES